MTANAPRGQILVVDDNEANRYTLVRLLKRAGFSLQEAVDGRQGLDAAHPDLDLIILDIRMPELDGYQVCRALKADPVLRAIPVLHISATHTSTRDIATGLEGGADGYLTHPVDPEVLLGTVRAFIRLRQADRALRESETRARARAEELEAVMAAAPAAVMIAHDPDCRIITGNPAAYDLLGMPPGDHANLSQSALDRPAHYRFRAHGVDLAPEQLPVQTAARSGRSVDGLELEIAFEDGVSKYIYGRATPLFDRQGSVRGAVGVFVDITAQRDAVAQLERAQRLESIGRLAGGIAHETNNQMAVVLGLADYVMHGSNLTEEQRRDLTEMRRAADRVAQLTRQLLALSRRQVLHTEPVELDRLVRESHRMLARLLGPEYPLRLDLDTAGRWVRADRTQLVQVLLNLGINARDAMPGGGPVTIRTRYQAPPATRGRLGREWGNREPVLVLAVSDSGGGIDPTISARIFEPFFTTKPVGGGTGLGLSVVEGIVAQSGGDIWVESAPRVGTTLSLALPEAAPPPLESNGPKPSAPGGGETVLIVDDEEAVRELLARQLAQRGYRVLEATDGAAALELLQGEAGHIALVVSDIAMPGMSGTDLAKQLRNQGRMVPFLFVSGQAREALGEYGDPGEYGPVLEKPFSAEQLAVAVGHALLARAEQT